MLAKRYRLTQSADFDVVRERGQCWADRRVVLCACANSLSQSRFGFIVSKRVGNAVVRNRARRLMREAIRLHRDVVCPGWDVVLIARRGLLNAELAAAELSVIRLLAQARLLCEPDECDHSGDSSG